LFDLVPALMKRLHESGLLHTGVIPDYLLRDNGRVVMKRLFDKSLFKNSIFQSGYYFFLI